MAATLDSLPLEILLEVASWLDWRSLHSLELVSARCRDVVALRLGQLRVFRVTEEADVSDVELGVLLELLPRLTALQELHVDLDHIKNPGKVLEAMVASSRRWSQLERLTIDWLDPFTRLHIGYERPKPAQLGQLCANCPRLTDVTLCSGADDESVAAVVAALPELRALRVQDGLLSFVQGDWLAQLPVELLRFSLDCRSLNSAALAQLARCGELRSLELYVQRRLPPEHLAAGLAGCARLERLRLDCLEEPVSDWLPPTGLHTLRHLDLTDSYLPDADLRRLLERMPGLKSVCLARCRDTTSSGLALLGRLPMLSSLSLVGALVSDWVLDRLNTAPLVELQLGYGDTWDGFTRDVTPEGLLRLTQSCPTLRTVMLWYDGELVERVSCGPGVEKQHLLRELRAGMLKMTDLDMSGI